MYKRSLGDRLRACLLSPNLTAYVTDLSAKIFVRHWHSQLLLFTWTTSALRIFPRKIHRSSKSLWKHCRTLMLWIGLMYWWRRYWQHSGEIWNRRWCLQLWLHRASRLMSSVTAYCINRETLRSKHTGLQSCRQLHRAHNGALGLDRIHGK